MTDDVYDIRYLRGIEQFNCRNYFESHEIWEDLWRAEGGPARSFYKGLIQAAVALHHLGHGNLRGARTLWGRARHHLEPYRPQYLGLNVTELLETMSRLFARCSVGTDGAPCLPAALSLDELPHLRLASSAS